MSATVSFTGASGREYEFEGHIPVDHVLAVGHTWWSRHNVLYVVYRVADGTNIVEVVGFAPGEAAPQFRALGQRPDLNGRFVALLEWAYEEEGRIAHNDLLARMRRDG